MERPFLVKRRMILAGLGLLFLADLALAAYSLRASTALRTPMAQLDSDSRVLGLLNADIERAEKIRHDLPATVADCNRFDAALLPASTGNSAITSELDELAKKSGLQIQSLNLHHKDLLGSNLTEVDLETTVSGAYGNIVKFMNSLQRSHSFYIVESLSLQADTQRGGGSGAIRIGLHMKTYFRTVA
jgi:Type II secretion system (T2SS), protein M subtype b